MEQGGWCTARGKDGLGEGMRGGGGRVQGLESRVGGGGVRHAQLGQAGCAGATCTSPGQGSMPAPAAANVCAVLHASRKECAAWRTLGVVPVTSAQMHTRGRHPNTSRPEAS